MEETEKEVEVTAYHGVSSLGSIVTESIVTEV